VKGSAIDCISDLTPIGNSGAFFGYPVVGAIPRIKATWRQPGHFGRYADSFRA